MNVNLQEHIKTIEASNRVFHHIKGKRPGATVVFFAGIHGNEFAGVNALNAVIPKLDKNKIQGEVFGVYGNIKALRVNKRFIDLDLNRLWTSKQLKQLEAESNPENEYLEQQDLYKFIKCVIASTDSPIYFFDLHTTSSKTLPFITINDALINRKFSACFNVPVVLGIEEYLEGPLLSYLNTMGYVSLGFESGQHTDPQAVKSCEAFVYLVLNYTGNLISPEPKKLNTCKNELKTASRHIDSIFEVIYKYHIKPDEDFKMHEGFESFQSIKKGTLLANSDGEDVYCNYSAKLFMPLYQKSGKDGFFIIKPIPRFFLKLSELLRRAKADHLLTFLPGITWYDKTSGILKANLKVARFLTKSIFHLFGYRNKQIDESHLLLYNRERVAKKVMYKNETWY